MISDNTFTAFILSIKISVMEGKRATTPSGPHAAALLRDIRHYTEALTALRRTHPGVRVRDEIDATLAELASWKPTLQSIVKDFETDFVKSVQEDQNKLLQLHAEWDVTVGDGIE